MAGSSIALDATAPALSALIYIQASTVNVSNFVSMKLSGCTNYNIWKAQMMCLIESQELLHIIDAKHPFPEEKGVHMVSQYDKLVKGWIFGSINEKVLKDVVSFKSARDVWMKLESLFNPELIYTKGDTETQDLKYMLAFNVEISDFVSVGLSHGCSEYPIWKAEMRRLIESQELLHLIDVEHPFPEEKGVHMISQYDQLVTSWIFRCMDEDMLQDFVSFKSAREVWMELESSFNNPISGREETDKLKYKQAMNVDVYKFVTVKLSGLRNYKIWKAQILFLIRSQALLHIIDAEYPLPEVKGVNMIERYNNLVKKWMVDSMNKEMSKKFEYIDSARYVWMKLEYFFDPAISNAGCESQTQDLKYIQASNINVHNFVSEKLSGSSNYKMWKAQMLCLIKSQALLNIIDAKYPFPVDKGVHMIVQYDDLVKGWIFGSLNQEVFKDLVEGETAGRLWRKLEILFNPPQSDTEDSVGVIVRTESIRGVPEIENTGRRKRLYAAAVEGSWGRAKSIMKNHKDAATEAITVNGNTILHVAVEMRHNYFLEKLLEFLKDDDAIETENNNGQTALHIAAVVGNNYAAQLLIQKRKELLLILDNNCQLPLESAYYNMKLHTYACLLKSAPTSFKFDAYAKVHGTSMVTTAIFMKQYEIAKTMLQKYPELAMENEEILMAITVTFPADLGLVESFIYPSLNNVRQKIIIRCGLVFNHDVDDILRVARRFENARLGWLGNIFMILLLPVVTLYLTYGLICLLTLVIRFLFSMLYFLLWKVLAIIVYPIKNIEKKRTDLKQGKDILGLICDQMGMSNPRYRGPILEAVRLDAYHVVDEILYRTGDIIKCKNDEGYNVIQLAIINRAEKVYNLIYHIIERTGSHLMMKDSSENNLVHLAGRLAPSFVLHRTTGAALQMQRELLWREEVDRLMLPFGLKHYNKYKETPAMVFTREHQHLMKQGENWMKTTAESCSITAALIVTVVFAAAITVPGGSNQESGIPLLRREIAFTIFAIFNAFSLFTAATALLLFLSILTARFSERDFLASLPGRLSFGLLALFLSTTTMIVAFGAILFLVFCDHRPWMLAPIFGFALLPISVIVTIKLPLLLDLLRSTYVPIFGKKSYLESCKTNRKSTIFI